MQVGISLKHVAHLIKRFFGYFAASPLTPSERAEVADLLSPELASLFFGMQHQDQRHAYQVYVRSGGGHLAQAALLHDVGKSATRIGPFQRALATVCHALHLPKRDNWTVYLDHGRLGADMLAHAGGDALAVAFTRHHPGPVPAGVDPDDWAALSVADDV